MWLAQHSRETMQRKGKMRWYRTDQNKTIYQTGVHGRHEWKPTILHGQFDMKKQKKKT